jgi:hypothetical protein
MHSLTVTITYRDNKKESFVTTDFPNIGADWVTLYQNLKRTMLPSAGIARIEYDVTKDSSRKRRP